MEMATESLKTLNFKGLCSVLGYEKDHPTRDSQVLMAPIAAYLEEYETGGTRIPPNETANPVEAQACAYNFLVEGNRAEMLWPPSRGVEAGALVWERPEHQSMIIMAVTYIFRRRAFYNYQSRLKRGKKEGGRKAPTGKDVAKRPRSPTSEDGSDSEDEGMLGVDPAFNLAPWTQPPKRFGRRRCIQYLRSIDPQKDSEDLTAFTIKWLAKADNPWPASADNRLQIFMHEKDFYFSVDLKEDITRALINQLRRGTELEVDISGLQYSQFSKRVVDQIEYHTKQLTRNRFLEYELDGTPKKTKRFQHFWNDRQEYWKGSVSYLGDEKPKKRSRTAKPAKQHASTSPNVSPNLMRVSPVEEPIADLRSMAISAQKHMIQNFASASKGTESASSDVNSPSSPQSQTGECIKVETPAPYTTSYIDLISPESSRASTPEIELRTPIPVIAADLRSMERGAERNQESETPSPPSAEHRSANKDPEEDIRQSQSDDDQIWTEPVKDAGPILEANTPTARHSDSAEAQPGGSNGTTHTQLQMSPFRPKTPPLSTVTSSDWQSNASDQEPASRLIPTEETVPIPFPPPPTSTHSKSPSHSPSILPLFPHDTRAQYERDLAEFRNGASDAGQPNPPPPIHTPIPPFSSISNPSMQAQTTFSSSLSPNTFWSQDQLGSQDNNLQVPSQPISHSSIHSVQGYPGARNVSFKNVPMAAPPSPPHFQTLPTTKHTEFIQDHDPTTFNPLRPTFSSINRSPMTPLTPTVSPSSRSWIPIRSFDYQSSQTPPNMEGHIQDPNLRLPPCTPVQNMTRDTLFPTPPSSQVLEYQQGPLTPRQHGPSLYDPLVHNQQLYNKPHQNRDPPTSWPTKTLPGGLHQNPPNHIQVPGKHVPQKPYLTQNEHSYGTPMNHVPSNSTNRDNLQSPPAPLYPRDKPQEVQAYPKQFCPNPTAQYNLPSTPASSIRRDGTLPTLPYPSQLYPNAANKDNTPQTPRYPTLHNETPRIPPQASPMPCRKLSPVKEQTPSRGSVEGTTQKEKSTTPPHISLPEQLPKLCEKLSPAREQMESRASVESIDQRDKSTTPPYTSLPEQPPQQCEKLSPAREQVPSSASVESITQRDKSSTPPYGLLPEQLLKSGRRPYAFVPKPIPFSKEPTKEETDRIQHEQVPANSVKLSTDTRIGRPLPLNETFEVEEPRKRLELLVQTPSKYMDWDRPLSSNVLEESNIDQFFEVYAQHTGIPLSTLTTLSFNATFGNRETLVVHRDRGEDAWKRFKKRLEFLLHKAQERNPDEDFFEVWVEFAD